MRILLLLPLFAFAVLAGGCATKDEPTAQDRPAMRAMGQAATVEAGASDEAIGREIRRRLELAGPVLATGVTIEVTDGNVTLRGVAQDLAAAWQAEAAARGTPGVKLVTNDLLVQRDANSR